MICPICSDQITHGQHTAIANGLFFHAICYAKAHEKNEKKQNAEFAAAEKVPFTLLTQLKIAEGDVLRAKGFVEAWRGKLVMAEKRVEDLKREIEAKKDV